MSVAAYSDLVAARKACRLCPLLKNPAVISNGALDSDRIGPYSRWQGNINAQLVVVAQDFADLKTFSSYSGWPGSTNATNLTLVSLAAEAGIKISKPQEGVSEDILFFTNAVLCMKEGGMQATVPRAYYQNCGRAFLKPLISLIHPKVIVTLGVGALDATLAAFNRSRSNGLLELLNTETTFDVSSRCRLFPMAHPSRTVLNVSRSLEKQRADWRRMGRYLAA